MKCNHGSLGITNTDGFAQTMGDDYDCLLNAFLAGNLSLDRHILLSRLHQILA